MVSIIRTNTRIYPLIISIALLQYHCIHAYSSRQQKEFISPFRIIIDGGSTGSRLHIFEFEHDDENDITSCIRRGSTKAYVPLTAFARPPNQFHHLDSSDSRPPPPLNATHVAQHLLPLFQHAAEIIPTQYHSTTSVQYQATAGMRLLDYEEQEAVYDALFLGLIQDSTFVFESMQRRDIATLSGDLEAFYGAVAANYIQGLIDAELNINEEHAHHGPLGALDMGGASMQIGFVPSHSTSYTTSEEECDASTTTTASNRLDEDNFFSQSYLAYGVDQFRERLWDSWIEEHEREKTCSANIIYDPCSFRGYERMWKGYVLHGTGEASECTKKVKSIMDFDNISLDGESSSSSFKVGGVVHPQVSGKFLGMALFFFTLDCLRHLSTHEGLKKSWPNPSILELTESLESLCSRHWQGDLVNIRHNSHEYTREEVLPERCFESVYLVTLLRDGFGFAQDSRDITFTYLLNGDEVEWSMGMAIASFAAEKSKSTYVSSKSNMISRSQEVGRGINKSQEVQTTLEDNDVVVPHHPYGYVPDQTSQLTIGVIS